MTVSVLFVDDEKCVLRALERTLRDEGYITSFCSDPLDALTRIGEEAFDIVVSDFMMPNMSGVDFLALVRERRPASFRMLMTGCADSQATIRAINESAVCHYLEKPWTDAELKAALRRAAASVVAERAAKAAAPDLAAAARRFGKTTYRTSA